MNVFISSTVYDLIDLRSELGAFFREAGVSVRISGQTESDFEVKSDRNSIETCLVNVRDCDEFVIILCSRYGPSLEAAGFGDFSATHLEYREAVNAGKPIRMYVRDRLEADYYSWKANGRGDDVKLLWCKKPDDRRLFEIVDAHTQLSASNTRSNWVTRFTNSFELKQILSRDFKDLFARAGFYAILRLGRVPTLEVVAGYHSSNTRIVNFTLTIRNIGTAMAVSPVLTFENDSTTIKLRSLGPGDSVEQILQWALSPGGHLRLAPRIAYSTLEGYQIVDEGELQILNRSERSKVPDSNYKLLGRKYCGYSDAALIRTEAQNGPE